MYVDNNQIDSLLHIIIDACKTDKWMEVVFKLISSIFLRKNLSCERDLIWIWEEFELRIEFYVSKI